MFFLLLLFFFFFISATELFVQTVLDSSYTQPKAHWNHNFYFESLQIVTDYIYGKQNGVRCRLTESQQSFWSNFIIIIIIHWYALFVNTFKLQASRLTSQINVTFNNTLKKFLHPPCTQVKYFINTTKGFVRIWWF